MTASMPGNPMQSSNDQAGFSLIEMMIAMVLALLVAAGIVSVFQSTSSSNRVQQQLAVLQEEGRFAVNKIKQDVEVANSSYCSNTGGNAELAPGSSVAVDALRSPTIYAAGGNVLNVLPDLTLMDPSNKLPPAATPFSIPSTIFMRGYDCDTGGCLPVDPHTAANTPLPSQGKAINDRVVGSSVLTMRYLDTSQGWTVAPGSTFITSGSDGTLTQINLVPNPTYNEPSYSTFKTNDLAMLADCSNGQVFRVNVAALTGVLTPQLVGATGNFALPQAFSGAAAPKVFDFTKDFITVTYYLKVVDNGNGGTTGALIRRVGDPVDGVTDNELVRGVERLNFSYGVINANGNTEFLDADNMDKATDAAGNPVPCPPDVSLPGGMPTTGCLWRAVQRIEVSLLMDGQTPLYTLTPDEMAYIYTPDGSNAFALPSAHAIKPADQGFPDQLLRRQFTIMVALPNYNP